MEYSQNVLDAVEYLKPLSAAELEQVSLWLIDWKREVAARPGREAAKAEIIAELRKEGKLPAPPEPEKAVTAADFPEWKPAGDPAAPVYVPGDRVYFKGAVWESVAPGVNRETPGVKGDGARAWNDVTTLIFPPSPDNAEKGGQLPEEPVPWESGGFYRVGTLVVWEGGLYRVARPIAGADLTPVQAPEFYEPVEEHDNDYAD